MNRFSASELPKIKERLKSRSTDDCAAQLAAVKGIIADVRARGDAALFEYTQRFDGFSVSRETLTVTPEETEEAYRAVPAELVAVVRQAAANIFAYHERQRRETFFDGVLGQRITPIASAGVYVPGGKASYPSSVLMNIIPAKVAGVERIAVVTPAGHDGKLPPLTLVAAKEAGADVIYKLGGAQAIAALAYGTESVPPVDKITGPGNIYVALAKREVFGQVGIDMIAGPSEVLVIADEGANPRYVAADVLSQAEHDELASCILVTDSPALADAAEAEIARQTALLSKRDIVCKSLENYGMIIVTDTLAEAADVANAIAPEHLELCVRDPRSLISLVKNAGAIFMGDWSPEPLGDYFAGTNHVLPTNGTARFSSPLSVDDFIKKTSLIFYDREMLRTVHTQIERFAEAEGLTAHANSIAIRFEEE